MQIFARNRPEGKILVFFSILAANEVFKLFVFFTLGTSSKILTWKVK